MHKKLAPFTRETPRSINFRSESIGDWLARVAVIPLIMLLCFGALILRLFQLTIVKGTHFDTLSQDNRIKEVKIEAPRGKIFDRKGLLVATSNEIVNPNKPVTYKRSYLSGEATAHVVGFRQIASDKDIENDTCQNLLKINNWVGKSGIEQLFDCRLRGVSGKQLIEVDAKGEHQKILATLPPKEGEKITLSIDSELQQKAYEIIMNNAIKTNVEVDLTKHHIAIVASIPSTGEMLTLLSYPSFNPNAFENREEEQIKSYFTDPDKPLFNRATQGEYPPGSVFKPFVALGALETEKIDKSYHVEDTGTIKIGPQTFGNWFFLQYGKKDGQVDVTKGLARSNDIFFYKVGERMGAENIKKWAEKFGMGQSTNIGLPESEGLIPTNFWKRETLKERWYLGDTYNLSIGQGYLLTTPIQINQALNTLVNNGIHCQPTLEKSVKGSNRKVKCTSLGINQKNIDLVKRGMKQACQTGGTAWPFFNFGANSQTATSSANLLKNITVGCKTGTAQNHLLSQLPHAWFMAFAPFEKPEIAVTVMVEGAGEGSSVAAPIAKEMLEFYFKRTQ